MKLIKVCFRVSNTHTHAAAAMSHNPSVGLPGQVSLYYDGESVRSAGGGLIYDSSHFPVTSCFIQDVATTTDIPTTQPSHVYYFKWQAQ